MSFTGHTKFWSATKRVVLLFYLIVCWPEFWLTSLWFGVNPKFTWFLQVKIWNLAFRIKKYVIKHHLCSRKVFKCISAFNTNNAVKPVWLVMLCSFKWGHSILHIYLPNKLQKIPQTGIYWAILLFHYNFLLHKTSSSVFKKMAFWQKYESSYSDVFFETW